MFLLILFLPLFFPVFNFKLIEWNYKYFFYKKKLVPIFKRYKLINNRSTYRKQFRSVGF